MSRPPIRRALRSLTMLGGAVVVVLSACTSGASRSGSVAELSGPSARSGLQGTVIRTGFPLPDQQFHDTKGRAFMPARDADSGVTVLYFGYSHCVDVCHVVLANVASALRQISPAVRAHIKVLFVTTDPGRDTPRVLRRYLDRFDGTFIGLVAPIPTLRAAAAAAHIAYEAPPAGSSNDYEVEHGTQVTGFIGGKARVLWRADTTVRSLREDLVALATSD